MKVPFAQRMRVVTRDQFLKIADCSLSIACHSLKKIDNVDMNIAEGGGGHVVDKN